MLPNHGAQRQPGRERQAVEPDHTNIGTMPRQTLPALRRTAAPRTPLPCSSVPRWVGIGQPSSLSAPARPMQGGLPDSGRHHQVIRHATIYHFPSLMFVPQPAGRDHQPTTAKIICVKIQRTGKHGRSRNPRKTGCADKTPPAPCRWFTGLTTKRRPTPFFSLSPMVSSQTPRGRGG